MIKRFFLAALLLAAAFCGSAATYTETFNTDLGAWTTTAHLTDYSMNLGWQNSANAGGTAGEAGGLITRYQSTTDAFEMPRMLDTQHFLGTPLGLSSSITFSGKINLDDGTAGNQDVGLGYWNSSDPSNQRAILRILSSNSAGDGKWRFRTQVNGTSGTRLQVATSKDGVPLTFEMTWTPTGGGAGSLTGLIKEGATTLLTLPAATVAANGSTFDAFGMWIDSAGSTDSTITQHEYFDDVTYTVTVVPEPAAGLLIVLGLGALVFKNRK